MKPLSQTKALEKLREMKLDFAEQIRRGYEHRAKDCATCPTQGACCLDAHFVNVHITRLEAAAIREVLKRLPSERRRDVEVRIGETIARYELLSAGDTFAKTYACPLFEKGVGCLVHGEAKPLACIAHACYENKEDLPPERLIDEREVDVERLNELTYRAPAKWLPLPVWLANSRE